MHHVLLPTRQIMTIDETQNELDSIALELRTIAAFGLNFAKHSHDRERFEGVLAAAARLTAVDYFAQHNLPPLSPGHHLRIPFLFKQRCGEEPIPFFDRATDG